MATPARQNNVRYRRWCFTLNSPHYCIDYYSILERDGCKRFVYGFEVAPTTGRSHLQGYLEYTNPIPFSRLLKLISAHFEPARGTWKQNYNYCIKEGKSVSYGDWDLTNSTGGCRPTSKVSVSDIVRGLVVDQDENIRLSWDYVRHKRSIDELVSRSFQIEQRRKRFDAFADSKLMSWQVECYNHLQDQGNRKVCWYYDVNGGTGKSFFANILFSLYNYELFDGISNSRDITLMMGDSFKGIVIDVTRDDQSKFSYSTLERLKNGFLMTGKYQGYKRVFSPVPVIVFANFEPDRSRLSEDRWCVHCLDEVQKEVSSPLPAGTQKPPSPFLQEE